MATIYYKAEGEVHYYKARQKIVTCGDTRVKEQLLMTHEYSGVVFNADGKTVTVADINEKSSLEKCEPYLPAYPRDVSLHSCAEDNKDYCLEFLAKLNLSVNFELLKTAPRQKFRWANVLGNAPATEENCVGKFVESEPFVLCHDHILWAYALRVCREPGDSYSLLLKSLGHTFGGTGMSGLSDLSLPDMKAPPLVKAELTLFNPIKGEEATELQLLRFYDADLFIEDTYTEEELRSFLDDTGKLNFSVRLIVPRSYFSIDRLINLYPPTVPKGTQLTVQHILQGKKPRSSDLRITAASVGYECCNSENREMPVYHVHKSAFGFNPALRQYKQGPYELAVFKGLCDHELRLVIAITYGAEVPLPMKNSADQIVDYMNKGSFFPLIKPHWEREMCRRALSLDKHNPFSCMAALLHLLGMIWQAGDGTFPVAKRVAIGVLADMAHLNACSSLQEWVTESVLTHLDESGCASEYVSGILTAFHKMLNMVPKVEKKIIPLWVDYWPS